jgi:hypothetical protein
MSNLAEYLAGTSPADPASRFMLMVDSKTPTTIRWTSEEGRLYTVYKSTNLNTGFRVFADSVAATPPVNSYPDPAPGRRAFYLIKLR